MNVEPALHVERITEILRAEVLILVDTFLEEKFCWVTSSVCNYLIINQRIFLTVYPWLLCPDFGSC
jgi:hypothetical protein